MNSLSQISFFDGTKKFEFKKKIRLISLFSGYDSQALALKYLGIDFEHYKTCEWAIKSIQALKDLHFTFDNEDYSDGHSDEFIVNRLTKWGISSNYNNSMTKEQIKRLGPTKQRQIYNNIKASHNLVNITQVRGGDLEICETDKFDYLMTYSFPCQDLSKAGKGAGMAKNSGTRSGLLWEVERILDECKEIGQLPQILLMENVPDVIGNKNIKHFANWLEKLESLGYRNYWKILNAKDYGIPQNRERCFMISLLGDYYFDFPPTQKLVIKLNDLLEENVDEKFYLSDRAIIGSLTTNFASSKLENKVPKNGISPTICARDYKDPKCTIELNGKSYPIEKVGGGNNYVQFKRDGRLDMENRVWNNISPTLTTGCGKTMIFDKTLKRKMCDDLIMKGRVKENDVIRHSYSTSRMNGKMNDIQQNNISPTLDTRSDCLGVVVKENQLTTKNKRLVSMLDKIDVSKTQAIDIYNQITHNEMHTIKTNIDRGNMTAVTQNLRIRKFTPKECFRLMGVKDQDFEKIAKNQSNASLYHLAGDSIVVNVLMAIFRQMMEEK